MALAKDHSQLPNSSNSGGLTPDENPRFIQALAQKWSADKDDDKPTALGTRVRHSDAGACARKIAYVAAGIPKSDPMDLTGVWNTSLGTLLHEQWQDAAKAHVEAWAAEKYPNHTVTVEVEPKVGHDDLDDSGHVDLVITVHQGGAWHSVPDTDANPSGGEYADDLVIVYELKTIGGYGFKAAIGKVRKGTPAEGPKTEHILQAALSGLARGADEIVIGYLAKECISVNQGKDLTELDRFAAEWTFTRDQYEPLAEAEKARVNGILKLLDDKQELAARKFPMGLIPVGAEIVDVDKGRWETKDRDSRVTDTGTFWACGYCSHRSLCATTEPGRIPVTSVTITKSEAA